MRLPDLRTTPHRRSLRLGCALLVGIALAGHLGAVLHQSLVRHAVCSEHGEATHGGDVAAARAVAEAAAHAALDGVPATAADDHEHCLLSFTRRDAALCGGTHVAALAPPSGETAPAVSAPARAFAPIATLRLAPKSSPPVLG